MKAIRSLRGLAVPALVSLSLFFAACGALAQVGEMSPRDQQVEDELRYIAGLQELGMQDYANLAVEGFRRQFPDQVAKVKTAELRSLLAVGNFDAVKALIAREPNQQSVEVWAMKLVLADGYYAWGRYGEAQGVYDSFFKAYPTAPPEAINDFYRDSAYKYAQMLLLMGRLDAAIDAYRNVLKAKIERHVKRQIQSEMTEIMIKLAAKDKAGPSALLNEAEKNVNELLWERDLWFGKGIVMLAHIRMLEGKIDEAGKLIEDYNEDLKSIHDSLVEESKESTEDFTRLSPLAQCRYLLGVMLQDEAAKVLQAGNEKKALEMLAGKETGARSRDGSPARSPGALQHFLNVFIRFPSSQWAPDAGVRAREVEELLRNRFGARIVTSVTEEKMDRVRHYAFQQARSEFNQQQFDKAAESYLNVLSLFPEGETSVSAVGELCQCYLELGEELHADAVAIYLAERFAGKEALMTVAGDQLLKLANYCGDHSMSDRRDAIYDQFFTHFKKHPRVSGMLYVFGDERYNREDYAGALKYYLDIRTNHPTAPSYFNALSKAALCYEKMGEATNVVTTLTEMVKELEKKERPGHILINARFRLAQAYRLLGDKFLSTAYNRYAELVKMVREPRPEYANTDEERDANQRVLEGSLFHSAVLLAQMKPSEEQIPVYRRKAVDGLDELVNTFPKSQFAPAALNRIGTFRVLLDEPEEARKAFDRLRKDYPDTEEAKTSRFLLANSLLQLGARAKAVEIFKEMFEAGGDYTAGQILSAGQELEKAGELEIALQAYERVLKLEKKRAWVEPALLGKGQVLLRLQRNKESVDTLSDLLARFANTGFTVPACLALSQAYAELAMKQADRNERANLFNDSIKTMNRARLFEKTPGGRERLNVGVARIYTRKATSEEQFGARQDVTEARGFAVATYLMLINLADPRDPEVRQQIEIAYIECLPLMLAMEKWEDVVTNADRFSKLFPRSTSLSEIRSIRTRARARVVTRGAPPPAGAADAAPAEEAVEVQPPAEGVSTQAPPAEAATEQP